MTIFAHVAQAYMISHVLGCGDAITVANVVSAAIPDLGSLSGQLKGDYSKYVQLHSLKEIGLIFFPAWALHNVVDFLTHDPLGGWYKWTYYIETVWWVGFGFWFFNH
jgi:hypothetical protein